MRHVVVGLALLTLTGCVGPVGRIGFDRDVIQTLATDAASWCITVDMATFIFGVAVIRVSYWREGLTERPMSDMSDCTGTVPLLTRRAP